MPYAKIVDGAVAKYPLTKKQVRQAFYPSVIGDAVFENHVASHGYVPVIDAPRPAISHEKNAELQPPSFVDGEWKRLWAVTDASSEEIAERFAGLKDAKRGEINVRRDAAFNAGFTVSGTGTALDGEVLQTRGIEDRTNWLTSQAAYAAAVAAGQGATEGAVFRTNSNNTVAVTFSIGLNVLLGMAAWGKAVMGNSWTLKDAVEAAGDKAELDAIDLEAGWP